MADSVVTGLSLQLDALRILRPADWISGNRAAARAKALAVFGHERKIDALLDIAATAAALRADGLRRTLADLEPLLRSLPYVGPVTWGHLAQSHFGVAAAKADRHMLQFARAASWRSAEQMC